MSNKLSITISIALIAIAFIAGAVLYSQMPDQMPSHWNAAGEIDDYMPKFWGIFMMPLVTIGLLLMFVAIPYIDPLKANIAQFRGIYNIFILLFTVYMLFIHTMTLLAALGYQFNMTYVIIPAVGLIFIGTGFMIRKAKRNFFIGIRTPWTLSSDYVWEETHKLGGVMFMIAGVVTMLTAFFGETGVYMMMAVIMLAAFVPIIYSFILWQKVSKS
jgi:uncharacterized membrane protein